MSISSKLADLFVEWSMKGIEGFQAALTQAKSGLEKVQQGADAVGKIGDAAFRKAGLALTGLVTAGVAMSAQGAVLTFQMERLSRTVAGLFGPEIRKVIEWVTQLVQKLQQLTEHQRAQVARWIEAAAAMLAVVIILPRLLSGVQAVIGGVRALTAALVSSGWGAILVAAGALLSLFLGLGAAGEVAQNGIGGLFATIKPLLEVFSNLVSQVFSALQPLLAVAAQVFEGIVSQVAAVVPQVAAFVGQLAGVLTTVADALAPLVPLILQVFGQWLDAVMSLLPPLGDLIGALAEVLVPVIQLLVAAWMIFQTQITVSIRIVGLLARVLNFVLVPVLKAVAFLLNGIVAALAFLMGVDLSKKAPPKLDMKGLEGHGTRGPLAPRPGGFEEVGAMFTRLALASRLMGGAKSPEEQAVDHLAAIRQNTAETRDEVRGKKPDVRAGKGA